MVHHFNYQFSQVRTIQSLVYKQVKYKPKPRDATSVAIRMGAFPDRNSVERIEKYLLKKQKTLSFHLFNT